MKFYRTKFSEFKFWIILMNCLIGLFGLLIVINSISTSAILDTIKGEGVDFVRQVWWIELCCGILALISCAISFSFFFCFKRPRSAVNLISEGIILWPLMNFIEFVSLLIYAHANPFQLAPISFITMLFCFISSILGIIGSINYIDEAIRTKISVAAFISGIIGIIFGLFQGGDLSTFAIIINVFFILIGIAGSIFFIRFVDEFDYFCNYFFMASRKNNENTNKSDENLPGVSGNLNQGTNANKSIKERLEELEILYKEGHISEEQYKLKKNKIIDEI